MNVMRMKHVLQHWYAIAYVFKDDQRKDRHGLQSVLPRFAGNFDKVHRVPLKMMIYPEKVTKISPKIYTQKSESFLNK